MLLELAMKGMYTEKLETASQIAEALKLSSNIVNQLLKEAKERKFVEALALASGGGSMAELRLSLTRAGRDFADEAMKRGQYFGPAPVSLKDYQDRILRQRVTNEHRDAPEAGGGICRSHHARAVPEPAGARDQFRQRHSHLWAGGQRQDDGRRDRRQNIPERHLRSLLRRSRRRDHEGLRSRHSPQSRRDAASNKASPTYAAAASTCAGSPATGRW